MPSPRFTSKVNLHLTHSEEDLPKLNDIERQILEMRLGIGNYNRTHTLQEISNVLSDNRSHTWARDKLNKILNKVRYIIKDDINDRTP